MSSPLHLGLEPHFAALESFLAEQEASFEPEVRPMVREVLAHPGKRLRPLLAFGSGAGIGPSIDLVRGAAIVELVHLATLVHDDVLDGADTRHGADTPNHTHGAHAAVLFGDALFAHALVLASEHTSSTLCSIVARASRDVCSGEVCQTFSRGHDDLSLEDYYRHIRLKTAELFRVSCFLGARLAGFEGGYVEAVSRFGRHLGIAYQIYDDLLDFFGEEARVGKTLGTDLASGKLTLPLLILLERLSADERTTLTAELAGGSPPQPLLRLGQMRELGVFAAVSQAVEAEIAAAIGALRAWPDAPPTPLLLGLCDVLHAQVASVRPSG